MKTTTLAVLTVAVTLLSHSPAQAQVIVPAEFEVTTFTLGTTLSYVSGLAFDGNGVLHASEANVIASTGRVLRLEDLDGDGIAEGADEIAGGFGLVTGIAFRGIGFPIQAAGACSGASSAAVSTDLERIRRGQFVGEPLELFVSHFAPGVGGGIARMTDSDGDGVVDDRSDIVTGLPSDGDNGNQQIAVGFDGRLYFGQGARTNSGTPGPGQPADEPRNGTILSVEPDGSSLTIHASGLRNAFDLLFTPTGELIATENGPDPSGPNPVLDAPDEFNAIVTDGDYGWPTYLGFPPTGSGTIGPIALFGTSTSTDGIALVTPSSWCGYEGDIIAAQFGAFGNTTTGRRLLQIDTLGERALRVDVFATGFGRPLDVAFGPDDALYVADFSNAFLAPASAAIYRIAPRDTDGDGTSDLCENLNVLATDRPQTSVRQR